MTRILIGVPTFENVCTETFKSIYDLKIPGGVSCDLEFVKGYDCARARNLIVEKALNPENDYNYKYIFMVDSDIVLPHNALSSLLTGLDFLDRSNAYPSPYVMIGAYPRKDDSKICDVFPLGAGYPNENKLPLSRLTELSKQSFESTLIKINGGGLGCALINTQIFKKLMKPYFYYINYSDGNVLSEDLYFCSAIRNAGYDVYLDSKVICKHIGKKTY